ncbi:FMN reductase [Nocardioides sp. SYSU D00038]|uniref:FMN reductase n=1 Tax=Nocardioides sp. SYSU D00038 TaxID=2812554 RepID=UPI001967854C|nr:FMN reductase [Nocardioides sp. SYSU D00038]
MTRRVVVVSAGLSVPSSTRLLADRLGAAVVERLGADTRLDVVELRPLAHALADALVTGFASGDLAEAQDLVRRADGLVVVTPVFAASYSGLFKTFFDVLEQGTLDGKPVLLGATAGTARHSLVLDHALRPLFSYLHAVAVPTGVFAATDDFGTDADLSGRIARAAGELADLVGGGPALHVVTDAEVAEAGAVPFEQLLARASGRE